MTQIVLRNVHVEVQAVAAARRREEAGRLAAVVLLMVAQVVAVLGRVDLAWRVVRVGLANGVVVVLVVVHRQELALVMVLVKCALVALVAWLEVLGEGWRLVLRVRRKEAALELGWRRLLGWWQEVLLLWVKAVSEAVGELLLPLAVFEVLS